MEVGVVAVSGIDALADRVRYLASGQRPAIEIGMRDVVTSAVSAGILGTVALLVVNALARVAGWAT